MESELIQPSKDEECCCCNTNDIILHKFIHGFNNREHRHCDICYNSLIGNTCTYREQHLSNGRVQQAIAYCTNIILKAINKNGN